ncbi:carbohydrate-binding protein [Cellvibrio mixtus]|jgi:polyisoprenoid-binding protein YceI|uniref:Carbohydrate-binding protein n=1 Tax=Cellvibrio mixtus TaxID=39650 RepID=A0A266Q9U0_9GAMM|nr:MULTISPECIES: cellulose binding domain-containing protein [Cellvibrio]AQT62023.1 carbohydrate-binding protein [Cellvibrio sp. PSBB023]OZY86657.1 carbohydrate-binding protein [Cellvibrio mixtus]
MSSFTASAITPRPRGRVARSLCLLGFTLATAVLSAKVYAGCQYVVTNQWNNGFTAAIRITNTGTTPINGWNVSWQYSGDNRLTSNWNANYSGTNPYSASNLGWNGTIPPNQTVEIGFQGSKGSASAEVPQVTGAACGATTSSVPSSSVSSSASSIPSSISSSSRSSSSVSSSATTSSSSSAVNQAAWDLNSSASYLNFVTTKNTHNVEVHTFTTLTGAIGANGVATVTIDLNSVSTGVALRDQRVRDLLFETVSFPTATITVPVPATLLSSLALGQTTQTDVSANVDLHGVTVAVTTRVSVQRLSNSRILVQSMAPVLTRAGDFNLTAGVEALRTIVNLTSISAAVPVDFALVFDAR